LICIALSPLIGHPGTRLTGLARPHVKITLHARARIDQSQISKLECSERRLEVADELRICRAIESSWLALSIPALRPAVDGRVHRTPTGAQDGLSGAKLLALAPTGTRFQE
jgi:hypothetical protein